MAEEAQMSKKERRKLAKKERKALELQDKNIEEYEEFETTKKVKKGNVKVSRQQELQTEKNKPRKKETPEAKAVARRSQPKEALTPFKLFCLDHPGKKREQNYEEWQGVPENDKAVYRSRAQADEERHVREMSEWREAQQVQAIVGGGKKEKRRM